jgi:hypothetical protein
MWGHLLKAMACCGLVRARRVVQLPMYINLHPDLGRAQQQQQQQQQGGAHMYSSGWGHGLQQMSGVASCVNCCLHVSRC